MQRNQARVIAKPDQEHRRVKILALVALAAALLMSLPALAAGSAASDSGKSNAYSGATKTLSATMRTATKLINTGDYEAALPVLQVETTANPKNADAWNLTGFAARKLGRHDQAGRAYNTALTLNPKHKGALEYQGELFLTLGQLEKAEANLALLESYCSFNCTERTALLKAIIAYKKAQ